MTNERDPQQGGSYLRDPKTGQLKPIPETPIKSTEPPKGDDKE